MDMIGQRRRDAVKGGHGNRMNVRRKLVVAFCAGAFASLVSFAQAQGKVWRIGFLSQGHLDSSAAGYAYGSFTQGLRELGHVELERQHDAVRDGRPSSRAARCESARSTRR